MLIAGCGCSFTCGYLEADVWIESYIDKVAQRFKSRSVNLAVPGASNYQIAKQVESAVLLKPDLVIIGVTVPWRYDFTLKHAKIPNKITIHNFVSQSDIRDHISLDKLLKSGKIYSTTSTSATLPPEVAEFHKKHGCVQIASDKDAMLMLYINSMLRDKHIDHIFVDFYHTLDQRSLPNVISFDFFDMAEKYPYKPGNFHFNEQGNEAIADAINRYLTQEVGYT